MKSQVSLSLWEHLVMPQPSLKDLLPPVVIRAYRNFRSSTREYGSLSEAEQASRSTYDSDEIATVVVTKAKLNRSNTSQGQSDLAAGEVVLFAALLGLLHHKPIRVLDFGGAAGGAHDRSTAWFPEATFDWRIVETASMAALARPEAHSEVTYFTQADDAVGAWEGPPHLILLGSTLQYLEEPLATLQALAKLRAESIVLTRTPLADSDSSHFLVQSSRLSENGPGEVPDGFVDKKVRYPVTFVPERHVFNLLQQNYRLVRYMVEEAHLRRLKGGVKVGQYSVLAHQPIGPY